MLECLEMNPEGDTRAVVIWLHGLGADGNDFLPIVPELNLPDDLGVRFVFPHAPIRPVTLNNGMAMRAWYDIFGLDINRREDAAGVEASRSAVEDLIQREKDAGIPANRIFLAGFSQGGAIVLHTGLRHAESLGGILALSTYLPLRDQLADEKNAANAGIPIFMAHGSMDPMLPQQLGELSRDLLQKQDYEVAWHSYPMQHQVCMEEINDLSSWLQAQLSVA